MKVIGAGVGRTGTYSLKLALEMLGFGPCHHMEEVIKDAPLHVPIWHAAVEGKHDWENAYRGYNSAVDWPTAAFWKELSGAYPDAKFVLTAREPEKWYESFSQTIFRLLETRQDAPAEMKPFLEMGHGVTSRCGISAGMKKDEIIGAYSAHCEAVRNSIPSNRLLVFEVKEGWQPLCEFLGKSVPEEPFPKSNGREEFWERLAAS